MDYLSLKAAVSEAEKTLSGSKATDAWQAGPREVVLVFRRGPGLVLSVDPVRPGLFLMDPKDLPERIPSPFTDLLRVRVRGTTAGSIYLPQPGERVVFLDFAAVWPAKKGAPLQIVLEVMGRRSNLMLLEAERILQPLKPVSKDKSRTRPVVAGDLYRYPPALTGVPVENVTFDSVPALRSREDTKALLEGIRGLSPYTASQALKWAFQGTRRDSSDDLNDGQAVVRAIREMTAQCTGEKGYLLHIGRKIHLSPFEPLPADASEKVDRFSPFSAASGKWRDVMESVPAEPGDGTSRLERGLQERLKRLDAAMDHVDAEEGRCRAHEEMRVMAEALLINANTIKPGSDSVTLPDPYDAALKITVPLDPVKNPQENANDLFNNARRLRRGLEEVGKRRLGLEGEMVEIRQALEALADRNDQEPARRLLGPASRESRQKGRGTRTAYGGPGRRLIVEGFIILVGKSSTDNEKVTFQAAGPNDLWLHARDYPGSHVVILTEKRQVPDKVLFEAAALAAAGSGARNDTAPEIMVTERKWVRKLKGGKPGQVMVERFRTVRPRRNF